MMILCELKNIPYGPAQYLEYEAPEVRKNEILRYSGVKPGSYDGDQTDELSRCDEVIKQAKDVFTYRVMARHISLTAKTSDIPVLDIFRESKDLEKNLTGCAEAIVFAATVGAGIDHLIRRYERVEPSRSLMLQAHGAERVESLCDVFNEEVKKQAEEAGYKTHPRFSPGYGDLPLKVQPMLLKFLDAEKRLGITLGESLMMSPSKSVTAIIGLEKTQ